MFPVRVLGFLLPLGLIGAVSSVPVPGTDAAAPPNVRRVGILSFGGNADVTLAAGSTRMEALRGALQELGYRDRENIAFTIRVGPWQTAAGLPDTSALGRAARELVAANVELIVAGGSTEALVAMQASSATPIVFWSAEPIAEGLVETLERPGRNATGVVPRPDAAAERLEILNAIRPGPAPIAYLFNPTYLPGVGTLRLTQSAADSLGVRLTVVEVRDAAGLEAAFDTLAPRTVRAVLVGNHGLFRREARRIAELALRHKLPLLSPYPEARDAGVLVAAVPDFIFWSRRAAHFIDRILQGATPAGLPIEQSVPTRYTLNLRTAVALGIEIPGAVLRRADRIVR